jgi:hypothetical protein
MYLTDASCSEGIEINFTESLLPVISILFLEDFDNLLDRHYVSLTSCLLHGIDDNLRDHVGVSCTQDLAQL